MVEQAFFTPHPSEAELVQLVRHGDRDALGEIFRRYYADLCAYAASLVGPDYAEDVVADIFQRIWARRTHWEPEHGVAVYLYGAARNTSHNVLRTRRTRALRLVRAGSVLAPVPVTDAAELVEREDSSQVILRAIEGMGEPRQTIIRLRWLHQLSFSEIAAILGMNRPAVQMHVTRAVRALREQLGERA